MRGAFGIVGVNTGLRAHQAWAAAASSYEAFVVELCSLVNAGGGGRRALSGTEVQS